MHILQPKHSLIKSVEAKKLLEEFKINKTQLPKIKKTDLALPLEAKVGDIIKIERKYEDKKTLFFRVVIP